MDDNLRWYLDKKIETTIENLKKHNMLGIYIKDRGELLQVLEDLIDDKSTIGIGDSMTLFELGIIDYLRARNLHFLDKYSEDYKGKDKKELYRANFSADTFLTGTNAITEKGELYNIDGNGSRVAPMIYGPDQVIVVVGVNKIVRDLDEAKKRASHLAAPVDAKRLGKILHAQRWGIVWIADMKSGFVMILWSLQDNFKKIGLRF